MKGRGWRVPTGNVPLILSGKDRTRGSGVHWVGVNCTIGVDHDRRGVRGIRLEYTKEREKRNLSGSSQGEIPEP